MKIGFIGYGNMGRVLLNSLLESGALAAEQVVLFNRSIEKIKSFAEQYPDAQVVSTIKEAAELSDILFICTGTSVVHEVIEEIRDFSDIHVVLINAGVKTESVELRFDGKITRTIPTMTSEVGVGYTIVNHNKKVNSEDRLYLEALFNKVGDVVELDEEQFAAGSDLTSCAPAIIAEMHNLYIRTIAETSGIPIESAAKMFNATLMGTQKLLAKTGETSQELIDRVATPGGATEAAISVLRNDLPKTFREMMKATENAHCSREELTLKQFENA